MHEITAEHCRAKVSELKELAERCGDVQRKGALLQIADEWERLADYKEAGNPAG